MISHPVFACAGKHAFGSKKLANEVARRMHGASNSYRCGVCGSWHVGHGVPKKATRKRIAEARDHWRLEE